MITNPVKAIRAYCLQCCCGQATEVQRCTIEDCALYPFRFGKNPYRVQKEPSEAQLAARARGAERLVRLRMPGNNGKQTVDTEVKDE